MSESNIFSESNESNDSETNKVIERTSSHESVFNLREGILYLLHF